MTRDSHNIIPIPVKSRAQSRHVEKTRKKISTSMPRSQRIFPYVIKIFYILYHISEKMASNTGYYWSRKLSNRYKVILISFSRIVKHVSEKNVKIQFLPFLNIFLILHF